MNREISLITAGIAQVVLTASAEYNAKSPQAAADRAAGLVYGASEAALQH